MREGSFEMQITNLNKEKAALKIQLDQTLEELSEVRRIWLYKRYDILK